MTRSSPTRWVVCYIGKRSCTLLVIPALFGLLGCPPGEFPTDSGDLAGEACDESVIGNVCSYVGTPQAGMNGDGLDRRESWLYFPIDIEFSEFGPPILHDWNNHRLRIIEDDDTLRTIMGTSFVGDGPADLSDRAAPGALGTTINLNHPTDGVYLPDGSYIDASWHTHKLRKYDPSTGLVYVLSGDAPGYAGDDGLAPAAYNQPKGIVYDESREAAYILDMRNARIRRLELVDGTVSTIAGNGAKGFAGDDGPALDAMFAFPSGANPRPGGGLALDGDLLYVADTENNRIRCVDLASGKVSTVVGTGEAGFSGDGGPAVAAQLSFPMDLEVEGGTLWIADTDNQRVRAVDLATGLIRTVAGNGEIGDWGDDGPALDAALFTPMGVEIDLEGNLYIADSFNHRIRRVAQ